MSGRRSIVALAVLSVAGALVVATPSAAAPGWISEVSTLTSRLSAGQYEVVLAPDGTALATWVEETGTNFLLVSSHRPRGDTWTAAVQVDAASGTQDAEPSMAVDGQGHVVAAWRDFLPGRSGSVIRTATFDGASWSPSRDLSPTTTHAFEPDVATNARGDAAVIWTQNVGSLGSRAVGAAYRASGGQGWATSDVTTNPGANKASAAVNASGLAIVVWIQNGQVVTADRTPAAGEWSATRVLSTNSSQDPQVIVDADGHTTAAWTIADISGASGVEVATRPRGAAWEPTTTLARSTSGLSWRASTWAWTSPVKQSQRGSRRATATGAPTSKLRPGPVVVSGR